MADLRIASDDLPARVVKPHTLDKFDGHEKYCGIFTKGMAPQWKDDGPPGSRLGYLELFAGPGRAMPGFRKFHDLRVTSITNGVRANEHGVKLQARAGHSNFATTQRYVDLAAVVFHEEAAALEERMLGSSTASSTRLAEPQPRSGHRASRENAAAASPVA